MNVIKAYSSSASKLLNISAKKPSHRKEERIREQAGNLSYLGHNLVNGPANKGSLRLSRNGPPFTPEKKKHQFEQGQQHGQITKEITSFSLATLSLCISPQTISHFQPISKHCLLWHYLVSDSLPLQRWEGDYARSRKSPGKMNLPSWCSSIFPLFLSLNWHFDERALQNPLPYFSFHRI